MPEIQIDGKNYKIAEGGNVLEACLSLGIDLPYFCWHPALGSVGACRQCAVKHFKNEKDTRGKLVMACMTPASDGTLISFSGPEVKAFRKAIIEWLMVNHPHDCPVCDEGGECHLQDMTVMTGHTDRRFRFKKRTFPNQNLGPFVNHEMNRCISCYRCVRFYRDYAGGHDLNVFSIHDHVYFGRYEDGVLENEFSGNLVEVCPTGVFTDKTLKRHYTRKWDLQTAPSVCVHCSLGCNLIPGERYGMVRRIRNRYHEEINGYFLCDRGRYGYEFVNSDRRIRDIWYRSKRGDPVEKLSSAAVLERLGRVLGPALAQSKVIGIGSPRASLEANFALRTLVGAERFYSGVSRLEFELVGAIIDSLTQGSVPFASLREIEHSDAAFVLGEDVTNTAPRLALALRQSIRNVHFEATRQLDIPDWQDLSVRDVAQDKKGPLFIAAPGKTKLGEAATQSFSLAPDDIARLGFAVAHAIDDRFPTAPDLSAEMVNRSKLIAQSLLSAKKPAIVSGTGLRSIAVLKAAANIASALHAKNPETRVCFAASEANSIGMGLIDGNPLSEALSRVENGRAETLIVLENDLFRRADAETLKAALLKVKQVILLDHTATAMIPRSDVILPSTPFTESTGTLINNEGRAQKHYSVLAANEPGIKESWQWIYEIMAASGQHQSRRWLSVDDVSADLVRAFPRLEKIIEAAPPESFRIHGSKIARQSHRYSGRTAIHANVTVHEPKPPEDKDSPFSYSMEGFQGEPPAPLIPRFWDPGWNSVQSLNKFQTEVGGSLRGGPAGKKLFPTISGEAIIFRDIPPAFVPRADRFLAIPIHHIFGSEELSLISPGVSELAPRPYVAVHPEDAVRLGIQAEETINVSLANTAPLQLEVRFEPSMPRGVIGLPVGLPALSGKDVELPTWSEIFKQRIAGAA